MWVNRPDTSKHFCVYAKAGGLSIKSHTGSGEASAHPVYNFPSADRKIFSLTCRKNFIIHYTIYNNLSTVKFGLLKPVAFTP